MKIESHKSKISYAKFAASAGIYAGFALYLYQPHFKNSGPLQYLVVVNVCLAAMGCFLLSRRWIASFRGSFFAGAVYGFGPFGLGLSVYHPTVSLLLAGIPWLFCPAALCSKRKWRWVGLPLSALPFLAIVLAFQVSAHYRLFPIPIHTKLQLAGLTGLFAPLVALERAMPLVGFYHVPIAALLLGFAILLKAHRFGIMAIFAAGTIPAFCGPFLNVSPIIWLIIPVLCCSVVIGVGMQGIVSAGYTDRKWVLITAVIMSALAIIALLLATKYYDIFAGLGAKYARLFMQTAKMYMLGAIAVSVIFFMARAKLRHTFLRWAIICSATAVDMFLGARFIVDKIL
ncbi:MAG TPA: hypothetical protein HPP66_12530 [Planctomycetes bacterium]|nr:hypothetical protein [Planctomycetota bacterium]